MCGGTLVACKPTQSCFYDERHKGRQVWLTRTPIQLRFYVYDDSRGRRHSTGLREQRNRACLHISSHCLSVSPAQRIIRYITIGGHRRKSVSQETAKQLVFKMKFMGLAVVFLVLNVHSPAESAPTVILALPFTSALTASAFYSGLVATKEAALVGVGVSAASASTLAAAAVPAAAVAKVVAVKALGAGAAYYALTREAEEEK